MCMFALVFLFMEGIGADTLSLCRGRQGQPGIPVCTSGVLGQPRPLPWTHQPRLVVQLEDLGCPWMSTGGVNRRPTDDRPMQEKVRRPQHYP